MKKNPSIISTINRRIQESPLLSTAAYPFILAFPPLVVAALDFDKVWPVWLFSKIKAFSTTHPWIITVGIFWPLFFIPLMYIGRRTDDAAKRQKPDSETAIFLLKLFDRVVGKKITNLFRFHDSNHQGCLAHQLLDQAINTEVQIKLIVDQIYFLFTNEVTDEDGLEVGLARIERGKFCNFEYYLPEVRSPLSGIEVLQSPQSCISKAVEKNKICVVESIKREQKKDESKRCFCASPSNSGESAGSIICYPICDGRMEKIPYVISIKSSGESDFRQADSKRYKYFLDLFRNRIIVEILNSKLKDTLNVTCKAHSSRIQQTSGR